MSGADVPYQLRPNKFVDRRIFIEALARLAMPKGSENYIYVSMGGNHLVDHCAVYRELGIAAQFSFDRDRNTVARQIFNRPTDRTVCREIDSADLASSLDDIASLYPSKPNLIVWLDYTEARSRRTQLQEAEQVLLRLRHGDIFRITMNADVSNLKQGSGEPEARAARRAAYLRDSIGDAMPTQITAINDDPLDFPRVLLSCISLMTDRVRAQKPQIRFVPVLSTTYADGQRMLTAMCAVVEEGASEKFPNDAFHRWTFASKRWDQVHDISVPLLSAKERFKLDGSLKKSARKMLATLKFLPMADEPASLAALVNYKRYQRFYPAFRHVED